MNHEETLLFTGGEDGLVMVWQVSDREGKILLNLILILTRQFRIFVHARLSWFLTYILERFYFKDESRLQLSRPSFSKKFWSLDPILRKKMF